MYADDTVIYHSAKESKTIESILNSEIQLVANWMNDNGLILNLKKGKTEFVLYGASQNLRKQADCVIKINSVPINEETHYNYLGVVLDSSLSLRQHFDKIYKKASGQISLLRKIRPNLTSIVAESIYKAVIIPSILYCFTIALSLPRHREDKLQALQNRASAICFKNGTCNWTKLSILKDQRAAMEVYKALNGLSPDCFNEMFEKMDHTRFTRGNNSSIRIKRVRTEFGRKSFSHQGSLIFNKLSSEQRNEILIYNFKIFNFDPLSFDLP